MNEEDKLKSLDSNLYNKFGRCVDEESVPSIILKKNQSIEMQADASKIDDLKSPKYTGSIPAWTSQEKEDPRSPGNQPVKKGGFSPFNMLAQ